MVRFTNAPFKKITLGTGQTYQLKPYFLPKEAKEALTYHASNKNVTVSSKGKITAKKAGTAKVTIKSKSGKTSTVDYNESLVLPL